MTDAELEKMNASLAVDLKKREVLRNLELFVLDNSLRESTVGQLRGHTLENKSHIYDQVKRVGYKHVIVAAFGNMPRVDDHFVQKLNDDGEDMTDRYSFSEWTAGVVDGLPDKETVPGALHKLKKFNIPNVIFEMDLEDSRIDWSKFDVEAIGDYLMIWVKWFRENVAANGRVLFNFRDFPLAMKANPSRVLGVARYLSSLPDEQKCFGLIFEDPMGVDFPTEFGAWTRAMRDVMTNNGWSGKLLVHVHEKWGFATSTQIECLANGADGIWSSICREGAALGHACSAVTLMNLVCLGNKKVLEMYNCTELRNAAIEVTRITTGHPAPRLQPVYGERALDLAFDFGGIAGGQPGPNEFDLAKFFGEEAPNRLSTLASADMVLDRLVSVFGQDEEFSIEIAEKMKEVMIDDLANNKKEEYMSPVGLALLFDKAGGSLSARQRDIINEATENTKFGEEVLAEVRIMWDTWDSKEEGEGKLDGFLGFDSFYNGFMAPYFGCFKCDSTQKGLCAIDMDTDGLVSWGEFSVYLKWALHQYPQLVTDVDSLLSVAFHKGIIPAMNEIMLK